MVTDEKVKQLLERITAPENRVDELEQENEELRQENQQLRKENKRLRAKIRWHEGPHTPPSKNQSEQEKSSSSDGGEDDEQPCTDDDTPGRNSGHNPEWRDAPDPDQEIEVTCDCCPECGGAFDESGLTPADSSRNSLTHSHRESLSTPGTTTSVTPVELRPSPHTPNCSDEGQFGVNVIAQAALSRYDHRLSYRKIGDRFEQLHGLSCLARLHGTRPSALRAPVAVSTSRSATRSSKPTLSTLTRLESNATANRHGSGRSPPRNTRCTQSERVEEVMFPRKSSARTSRERSSVMAGRRIRPSAATSSGAGAYSTGG